MGKSKTMTSFLPQRRLKFIGTRFYDTFVVANGVDNRVFQLSTRPDGKTRLGSIKEASVDELLQEELDVSKL